MKDPYRRLADLYDLFGRDKDIQAFYTEWREWLLEAIARYKVDVRTLVDLACGTGNTAIPWTARRGWTVVGVDRSAAMLRQARKRSKRVRWYRQDLTELELKERADVVTCHFDAVSHIPTADGVQRMFDNVARILNEGGLFQFDMNTEPWFRWLAVHEKMFPMGPHFLMSRNEYDPARRTASFHQLWFVKRGKLYEKREITVQEHAYGVAEVRRMLRSAGLRVLKTVPQRKLEGKVIRMYYLARKEPRLSGGCPGSGVRPR